VISTSVISTRSATAPTATVCVSHLPDQTSEAELAQLFAAYGPVHRVRLLPGDPAYRFEKVGYVDLDSEAVADAIAGLDGYLLHGAVIQLSQVSASPTEAEPPATRAAPRASDVHPRNSPLRCVYTLVSVEAAVMPTSTSGQTWFRYVLAGGQTPIVGYHRGSLEEVTAFAEACAEDFNLRNTIGVKGSAGRTPHRTAPAPKPAGTGWN